MKIEYILSIALLAVHCAVFILSSSQGWSLAPVKWMTRIGMSTACLFLAAGIFGDIGFGLRPHYVAALPICLFLAICTWFTSWTVVIWLAFLLQCLTSAASVWFIFFFRLTRLF